MLPKLALSRDPYVAPDGDTDKAHATLVNPDVRLDCRRPDVPTLVIEEGRIVIELDFPDNTSLAEFQRRLSLLPVPGRSRHG